MAEEIKNEENVMPENENLEAENTDNLSAETSETAANDETLAENDATETAENDEKEEKKSFFGRKNKKEEQLKEMTEKYAQLEKQKKELNDKFLLLYSEFDNYKKRTNREKLDLMSTASEKVIVNLLPVIDDFERAIKANENLEDIQVMKDGFNLIYNKLLNLLKHFDVEEIAAKGEVFDTDFHEAVTHFPAPTEDDKGKVMDVTEKGYKIKDKVIRYAKVVVAQ
ncbi:MAG: nucleotide exchange factor GrpE [Bacteroidales bacterium]|nr:nucleotide exchange factor GrpE [Bacteroidales bacterium]